MCAAVLYRRLPGEGLDKVIAAFREAAARDPFGTVLIVPTSRLADDIAHCLITGGTPIVGDAVTTLAGFAQRVFEDRAGAGSLITPSGSRIIIADILAARVRDLRSLSGDGRSRGRR